ncbi:MAG: hypothetical protein ACOYU1_03610 [Bacteroidota bacterium]
MRFAGIYRKYLSPWVVVAIGGSVFVLTFLYLGQKDITNPYFIFHNPAYPIVSHAHGWLYVVQALTYISVPVDNRSRTVFAIYRNSQKVVHRQERTRI